MSIPKDSTPPTLQVHDDVKTEVISVAGVSRTTQELIRMLIQRDGLSKTKYDGMTLDREDLNPSDWDQHLLEELLDAAAYRLRSYQKRKKLEARVSAFLAAWETRSDTDICRAVDDLRREYNQP